MSDTPKRTLFLQKDIDQDSVKDVIKDIIAINEYDSEQEKKTIDFKREPIKLYIDSYGGECYPGYSLASVMLKSKTEIHTYVAGFAMSMAFLLSICGHKRFAYPDATFMYHSLRGWTGGSLQTITITIEEWTRIQKQYDNIVVERTNLLMEMLEDKKAKNTDWFITAEEALKLGIIHEIL